MISSSSIKPIKLDTGEIDPIALDGYEDFVVNLRGILDYYGYEEIEDTHKGNFSDTSQYSSFYKNTDSTKDNIEKIIFVRISDHELDEDSKKGTREYHKYKVDESKQPTDKNKQKWRFRNLIVNGERYESYDEALEELDKRISSWK